MADKNFEPKIVGFLCKWCSSSAADLAGTTRLQYPPNIRIIRMMCSGSVDNSYVVRALMDGADGVLILGCPEGDCHYQDGNLEAKKRVLLLKKVLESYGIEPERVRIELSIDPEGKLIPEYAKKMMDSLRKLGPVKALAVK